MACQDGRDNVREIKLLLTCFHILCPKYHLKYIMAGLSQLSNSCQNVIFVIHRCRELDKKIENQYLEGSVTFILDIRSHINCKCFKLLAMSQSVCGSGYPPSSLSLNHILHIFLLACFVILALLLLSCPSLTCDRHPAIKLPGCL